MILAEEAKKRRLRSISKAEKRITSCGDCNSRF
jgi:hypothetical protein